MVLVSLLNWFREFVEIIFAGAHIVLPHWYTHKTPFGLLLPETSDGRVLFLLPWEGRTLAGTTDAPALEAADPRPKEEDVDFLVKELSSYLKVDPDQMRWVAFWCFLLVLSES